MNFIDVNSLSANNITTDDDVLATQAWVIDQIQAAIDSIWEASY